MAECLCLHDVALSCNFSGLSDLYTTLRLNGVIFEYLLSTLIPSLMYIRSSMSGINAIRTQKIVLATAGFEN